MRKGQGAGGSVKGSRRALKHLPNAGRRQLCVFHLVPILKPSDFRSRLPPAIAGVIGHFWTLVDPRRASGVIRSMRGRGAELPALNVAGKAKAALGL